MKVLIVDDETAIRELIKHVLAPLHATILVAESGLEAVNMVKHHLPDLVILDIILAGGIDGLEATRMIKRNPQTHHVKVMITSGVIDLKSQDVVQAAPDAVLHKPFTPERLRGTVNRLIAGAFPSKRKRVS